MHGTKEKSLYTLSEHDPLSSKNMTHAAILVGSMTET